MAVAAGVVGGAAAPAEAPRVWPPAMEESEERPDPALDDERRRYYRMTGFGRRVVRAEAQRLAGAVTVAMAKLAGDAA